MARSPDPNLERTWRERLQRQADSGLSISEFCLREGLSRASFQAWKRRLATRNPTRSTEPSLFVPLKLDPQPSEVGAAPWPRVEIELPQQVRLHFDSPPEPEWLARVVSALAGLPRQEVTP